MLAGIAEEERRRDNHRTRFPVLVEFPATERQRFARTPGPIRVRPILIANFVRVNLRTGIRRERDFTRPEA